MFPDFRLQAQFVLSAISNGSHSLGDIARNSGGIYPLELVSILEKLIESGEIVFRDNCYFLAQNKSSTSPNKKISNKLILPKPHPLDFDWRFDDQTTQLLANLVLTETQNKKSVVLLGAPSVFVELAQYEGHPEITLLDGSNELINYLKSLNLGASIKFVAHDIMSKNLWESSEKTVDVVICDPPWYTEYYAAFLAQASHLLSVGGLVILSLLPINTRPNAFGDRWKIFEHANKLGLHIQSVQGDKIGYITPEFEKVSLHNVQINTNGDWRKGDLVLFRKTHIPSLETIREIITLETPETYDSGIWAEILIGLHKIKIRYEFDDYDVEPEIISIEPNDILPTVSRRYSGRHAVDIWLWDNRVYGLKGKASFWAALHTLAGKPIPNSSNLHYPFYEKAISLLKSKLSVEFSSQVSEIHLSTNSDTLDIVKQRLESLEQPVSVETLTETLSSLQGTGHLAILTKPYLDKIIAGTKTIESRFSKVRTPPFKEIKKGDILLLKETAGQITAIAMVDHVDFFTMRPQEAEIIMQKYQEGLAIESDFRELKKDSKYATLIHLGKVISIKPVSVSKTDRRPWVILNHDIPSRLF